jgi:hypothetical protein
MAASPGLQEWGMRMIVVARCLERIGDNAVDIGEQTEFLVTGEFHEFTDASHYLARQAGFRGSGILRFETRLRRGTSLTASALAAATA